ncbi:ATP12, ATP synthase F1-assembly protein [Dillenia turbinata]|uniref:ATP12, ATP synthase F1-assembly protein n=1 Tax=Dillenia turbinata TaxID=194707 RepID=A0AAN8UFI7_9MAGN
MASKIPIKTLKSMNPFSIRQITCQIRHFSAIATASQSESDISLSFNFSSDKNEDKIFFKAPKSNSNVEKSSSSSVTMPTSFMTGSIVGKRFYKQVSTREADDGNRWTVMLDYRTLKTPSKRPLKLPTPSLAKAIAAEWEYQLMDGIRPFTMPLMKLACTALERVPLTRPKIIENLMRKFHQDLVFCRAPGDNDLTKSVLERQVEKIDPLLDWVKSEFGFKPAVYSSFFVGKQEEGLVNAIEGLLKQANDCELAAIDAIAAAGHSLVDKWGLVEGGHDVDIADLKVQISSAAVFLGLCRRS